MRVCQDGSMHTEDAVVALGMFDGVHLGHRVLLQKARAVAHRTDAPVVVQTFSTHPLCLLAPDQCPPLLTTLEERMQLMSELGVDVFCAPPFDANVRDMPPEDFVGHLVRQWKPVAVVVGFNYTFGAKGAGTVPFLEGLGNALGFHTYVTPAIRLNGQVVSATEIRSRLEKGDPRGAWQMLSRPYRRVMRLSACEGIRWQLRAKPDRKLELPAGFYRVRLTAADRPYPALLHADGSGGAEAWLPVLGKPNSDVLVEYLTAPVGAGSRV